MRFTDLLTTALKSLTQRAFRTSLTVLGVVIGTISVTVMLSIGTGMSAELDRQMANPEMRLLRVFGAPAENNREQPLNSSLVKKLQGVDGVEVAYGVWTAEVELKVGSDKTWASITGIPADAFAKLDKDYASGGPFAAGTLQLVYGPGQYKFFDPLTGLPKDIDYAKASSSFKLIDMEAQEGFIDSSNLKTIGKATTATTSGVIAGDIETYTQDTDQVYADLETLVAALRKAAPGRALPGQLNANASPQNDSFVYNEIRILAEGPSEAEQIAKQLTKERYTIEAQITWIQSQREQADFMQAVLGGIGFISLFVAAIGIANTMLMSVYERTREIGIIKVLGASLRDIRNQFLLESASIGLLGGLIGVALSFAVSLAINTTGFDLSSLTGGSEMGYYGPMMIEETGEPKAASVITAPLAIGAVIGATLIGTVSGLLPAQRAMKLSPLAAIRSD